MRRLVLVLVAIAIMGCDSIPHISSDFAPYMKGSRRTSIVYGEMRNRNAVLANGTFNIVAECYRYIFDTNLIVVNKAEWERLGESERLWAIQHELGHCEAGLEHDETLKANGCPLSFMFPQVPQKRCLGGK